MKPRICLLGLLRNRTRHITDPMSTYSLDQRTAHWTELKLQFNSIFETAPTLYRAPGRVNLIGEHTDYNDGFVMPAAIEFYTWVAASRRNDRVVHVHSDQFAETIALSLDALGGPPRKHWSDFIRGVAAVTQAMGHTVSGANLVIYGQVPLGAGLSSSAALEVATALALVSV